MESFLIILMFVVFGFICFCIYFIFKILQFVIQAINLYKDMVVRQDAMIKILKDLRDTNSKKNKQFKDDIKVSQSIASDSVEKENFSSYDETIDPWETYSKGNCPECGVKIVQNSHRCDTCEANLTDYMK